MPVTVVRYGPFAAPRSSLWLFWSAVPVGLLVLALAVMRIVGGPQAGLSTQLGSLAVPLLMVAVPAWIVASGRRPFLIHVDPAARTLSVHGRAAASTWRTSLLGDEIRGIRVEHGSMRGDEGEVTSDAGGRIVFELVDGAIPECSLFADGAMLGGRDVHMPTARELARLLTLAEPTLVDVSARDSASPLRWLMFAIPLTALAIGAACWFVLR